MYGLRFWVPPGFLRARRNLLLAHKMQTGGKFKFRQSPPRTPSSLASPVAPRSVLSPFRSSPQPEAALVSLRNQPRADNNEIHKSVREHAEHPVLPRPGTSPLPLSLSRFLSDSTPYRLCVCCYLSLAPASLRLRDPRLNLIASWKRLYDSMLVTRDRVTCIDGVSRGSASVS